MPVRHTADTIHHQLNLAQRAYVPAAGRTTVASSSALASTYNNRVPDSSATLAPNTICATLARTTQTVLSVVTISVAVTVLIITTTVLNSVH